MNRERRMPQPLRGLGWGVAFLVGLVIAMSRSGSSLPTVSFLDATREDGRTVWAGCTILPVPARDRTLVRHALQTAMAAYPKRLVSDNARGGVVVASGIEFRGVRVGGLNWARSQTLLVGANVHPADDPMRAEFSFHHEFSHLLLGGHRALFPEKAWRAVNPPAFRYLDQHGLETLRHGIDHLPWEPCRRAGFVRPYSMTNLQEDVAMVAETLMTNDRFVLNRLARYPRLETKCRLLIRFYQSLDPAFHPPLGWDRSRAAKTLQVRQADQGASSRRATTKAPAV